MARTTGCTYTGMHESPPIRPSPEHRTHLCDPGRGISSVRSWPLGVARLIASVGPVGRVRCSSANSPAADSNAGRPSSRPPATYRAATQGARMRSALRASAEIKLLVREACRGAAASTRRSLATATCRLLGDRAVLYAPVYVPQVTTVLAHSMREPPPPSPARPAVGWHPHEPDPRRCHR